MKKLFVFLAAVALVSCGDPIQGDGPSDGGDGTKVSGVVFNEFSGAEKYIELYNNTDAEINLDGIYIVKYDSSKEGGKSTTWTGKGGIKIAAKGWVLLESSDLSDPAEDGDVNYVYESENHIFKGGLSGKKNLKFELYNSADELLDTFTRGEEGAGWNQVGGFNNDKKHSFSRVPDGNGEWAYADPTPKAANGAKVADIEQTPEM